MQQVSDRWIFKSFLCGALVVFGQFSFGQDNEQFNAEPGEPSAEVDGARELPAVNETIYSNPIKDSKFTISDGSRVDLKEKGISIIPPMGWEVHLNFPNSTLLMQAPFETGMSYQRTFQVLRFKGGLPIDDITGREFSKVIEQKFATADGAIVDFRTRNHMVTKVEDGTPAVLYYSEFSLGSAAIMQAHLLLSSATHHYLLTYTDLAEHFEGEQATKYLSTAWESMVSVQLESSAPMRMRLPVLMGVGFGFVVLIILLIFGVRRYQAGNEYRQLLGNPYGEDDATAESTAVLDTAATSGVVSSPGRAKTRSRVQSIHDVAEDVESTDADDSASWTFSQEADDTPADDDDQDLEDKAS